MEKAKKKKKTRRKEEGGGDKQQERKKEKKEAGWSELLVVVGLMTEEAGEKRATQTQDKKKTHKAQRRGQSTKKGKRNERRRRRRRRKREREEEEEREERVKERGMERQQQSMETEQEEVERRKRKYQKEEGGYVPCALAWEDLQFLLKHKLYDMLGRSRAELDRYRLWRARITQCYASPTDHLASVVYGYPVVPNEQGLFTVQEPPSDKRQARFILRDNDFPYFVQDGIKHSVLWSEKADLTEEVIAAQLSRLLPGCEYLYFINPPALQSVPRFKHCHVFWRQPSAARPLALEVCVDSVASAKAAQQGGSCACACACVCVCLCICLCTSGCLRLSVCLRISP